MRSQAQQQDNQGAISSPQSQSITPTIQAKQKPIQAKQKPIQAKQTPVQAKQTPIQRNTGNDASPPKKRRNKIGEHKRKKRAARNQHKAANQTGKA